MSLATPACYPYDNHVCVCVLLQNSTSGITRSDSNGSEHSRELALLESLAPPPDDDLPVRKEEREVRTSEPSSRYKAQGYWQYVYVSFIAVTMFSFLLSLPPAKKEDKRDSDVVQLLEVEVRNSS